MVGDSPTDGNKNSLTSRLLDEHSDTKKLYSY